MGFALRRATPGGIVKPMGKLAKACAFGALFAAGCGHPASRQECDEIFDKSAEIELRAQNVSDPKLIEERTAAVRASKGPELIDRCVGKRITSDALACVRRATTPEQMDKCLD